MTREEEKETNIDFVHLAGWQQKKKKAWTMIHRYCHQSDTDTEDDVFYCFNYIVFK